MRGVKILLVPVTVVGLASGLGIAQEISLGQTSSAVCCAETECGPMDDWGVSSDAVCEGGRLGCGCGLHGFGLGCGGCLFGRCAAYFASVGEFNCCCRGSYKFPVPSQYTYHWPGMYSLQTMSEYRSPYRFPPLEPPKAAAQPVEDEATEDFPVQQATAHVSPVPPLAVVPQTSRSHARLEPFSARIKRHYGLR